MENFIVLKRKELWTVSKNGIVWGVFAEESEARSFLAKYKQTNPMAELWEVLSYDKDSGN